MAGAHPEAAARFVADDIVMPAIHRKKEEIADHLALVVRARDIVHHMHEAYERLAGRPRGYGLFISGPSKTADIEQVLVVGAQGARTCTVLVTDG